MNKKGFTLIELLAVIVILAFLMIIAVPNVTSRILESRKRTFVADARTLASVTKTSYASSNYATENLNVIEVDNKVMYPKESIDKLLSSKLKKSSFNSDYKDASVYVATNVTSSGEKKYTYFVCLVDENGNGFDFTRVDNLNADSILMDGSVSKCSDTPKAKYKVDVSVQNGTVDVGRKIVLEGENVTFNLTPSALDMHGVVTCNHNGTASINGSNILTVNSIDDDTKCNVVFSTSTTVLYNDGTLIINERLTDRNNNVARHGHVAKEYPPLTSGNQYMLSGSTALWREETEDIKTIEIGQKIEPVSTASWFSGLKNLTSINLSNLDTSNVITMANMFQGCESLKQLNISHFNTSNVTNMSSMFSGMKNVESIIINPNTFDTSNVTNMSTMFFRCSKLKNFDVSHFDTTYVTDMSDMFHECNELQTIDVSHFNTSNVTNMNDMFRFCKKASVLDVSHFDTSNVTNMSGMFDMAHSITSLDVSHFNTSKVTNMSGMFRWIENVKTLDLSHFDTSNVTDMSDMFYNDTGLESLDLSSFDTSKVTDMNYMFSYLRFENFDIRNFDTRNVTNMDSMFYDMYNLKNLLVGPNFNTSKVTKFGMMFDGCRNLSFDFSKINTSSAVEMYRMLSSYGTVTGETLDLRTFDTSKVTDMMGMFRNVKSNVIRLDNFDFSGVLYHGGNTYKDSSVNFKMFDNISTSTVIYVKDNTAKSFVQARLQEAGKSNQVIVVS